MKIASALRELVRERAHSICEYCMVPQAVDPLPFSVDHNIAIKHHGLTEEGNLALSCFACDNHKGPNIAGIDQTTGDTLELCHPRRDVWTEHFHWNGPILVGRTPTGVVTVDVLSINLSHRLAFRAALINEGDFPPET